MPLRLVLVHKKTQSCSTRLPLTRARKLFNSVEENVGDDAGVGGSDVAGHLHHHGGGVDAVGDA